MTQQEPKKLTYRDAGVDIDAGDRAVELIKSMTRETYTPGVLSGIGGFGGLFSLSGLNMKEPVLVSGTDGVGTKLKLAFSLDIHDTVGIDAVAMCANDVICCGAQPLFFLDYLATGRLEPDKAAQVVKGIADGCKQAGCALIGGEMAEMPGFYADGEYDIAGFCVGAVDRDAIIDGARIRPGDALMALPSSGVHSNGFSMVRKIIETAGLALDTPIKDTTLGAALLEPTRIYARQVQTLVQACEVRGIAHITGGGLEGNIIRIIPDGLRLDIDWTTWKRPQIFDFLQEKGNVDESEMRRVFNLGIGLCVIVSPDQVEKAKAAVPELFRFGTVVV